MGLRRPVTISELPTCVGLFAKEPYFGRPFLQKRPTNLGSHIFAST